MCCRIMWEVIDLFFFFFFRRRRRRVMVGIDTSAMLRVADFTSIFFNAASCNFGIGV